MPNFDDALERLITDPSFAAALTADPGRALAGYTLSPDEAELLRSQVASGPGDGVQSAVEARTNQSSMFGLFHLDGFGAAPSSVGGFGDAPAGFSLSGHTTEVGSGSGFGDAPPVPSGYETRVDADGDGTWDAHSVRGRVGGGVEILVDRDGDGRADFIGHDVDSDGIVDYADYDVDRDGTVDERLTDPDGDGWLNSHR
ncbi:Os1348 family NHLP clan protein [Catenuloplanes sp. NPDC051500]|uniref:Os1348 family NHLP clan protein n=1 Tax=Catenuloplanes sp. NPDC051500 TaxID=3363959 RepID=UPI0037A381AA